MLGVDGGGLSCKRVSGLIDCALEAVTKEPQVLPKRWWILQELAMRRLHVWAAAAVAALVVLLAGWLVLAPGWAATVLRDKVQAGDWAASWRWRAAPILKSRHTLPFVLTG